MVSSGTKEEADKLCRSSLELPHLTSTPLMTSHPSLTSSRCPLFLCTFESSSVSPRYQENNNNKQVSNPQPRHSLRAYGRLAVICIRLCNSAFRSMERRQAELLSILQVVDAFTSSIDKGGLFFDPDDFTASHEGHFPQEAVRIMKMLPLHRTPEDISYLMILLRNIPAFAEYPTKMQKELCKVGWYESYEPWRAIIREGHPPHSFYFILSGTVVVTRSDPQSGTSLTLVTLDRGLSFGELAVVCGSKRRQATVSSKTRVQLLCISTRDFEKIFMAGGIQTITDPFHNSFLRSVACLKHWPIHQLPLHPNSCMFHYFNRGQVLVRDSNNSDWIYIVKSGSLSVLKKLRHARANDPAKRKEKGSRGAETKARRHRSRDRRGSKPRGADAVTPTPESFRNQMEADRRLEQTLPGAFSNSDRLGLLDYERVISEYRARVTPKVPSLPTLPPILPAPRGLSAPDPPITSQQAASHPPEVPASQEEAEAESEAESEAEEVAGSPVRPISKTAKGVYLAPSPTRRRPKRRVKTHPDTSSLARAEHHSSNATAEDNASTSPERGDDQLLVRLNADYQRRFREKVGRKTLADQLDHKGASQFRFTQVDLQPMFVAVQVLERGQYFGVSQLLYPDQPSLSLISNGAELIIVSKKLFMEHASETCIRHLRLTESPYPADDALQHSLQDYVDWEAHRARVYRRLVTDIRRKQDRRKQYLPSIPGQYCFRSGPV